MTDVTPRAIIIVLDSVGIGAMPDAAQYGDEGSDTLGNIAETVGGLCLPNFALLGLGNIRPLAGMTPSPAPMGFHGKMGEASRGKDTTMGHWEIAGVVSERPFPTYPGGFPREVLDRFSEATGKKAIGNYPASGTEIISQLGEEHMKTGALIVYTSADSVFQIAAHEQIVPIPDLYRCCEIARGILTGEHAVARVIARPFIGGPGSFTRTDRRHDYSLPPPSDTMLDLVSRAGMSVVGIGKIHDIFAGKGVTDSIRSHNNLDGISALLDEIRRPRPGILFINLVDFDMLYGHRRDVVSYYRALQEVDDALPGILSSLADGDLLFITADHGCDPTFTGTDHTREYVPLLVYGKGSKGGGTLGTRGTFADVAKTICEYLGMKEGFPGKSFLKSVMQDHAG